MQPTKIKLLLVLAFSLLWTVPSFAGSFEFYTTFFNNSATRIEAVILYASGDTQKDHQVASRKKNTFQFGQKCKKEHTRKFEVIEKHNGKKNGQGQFTMKTGRQKGDFLDAACKNPTFIFDSCADLDSSDSFTVSCETDGSFLGEISID